jgi:DNA polymerase-3 subunit epsilon
LRSRGLDSLANYFGIEIQARHRAGGDAIATAQVLRRLLDLAVEQGAGRLIDLHRLGRRARRRRRRNPLPGPMEQF